MAYASNAWQAICSTRNFDLCRLALEYAWRARQEGGTNRSNDFNLRALSFLYEAFTNVLWRDTPCRVNRPHVYFQSALLMLATRHSQLGCDG